MAESATEEREKKKERKEKGKNKRKRSKGAMDVQRREMGGGGESCIFHAKSSSRSEARVQHVLSSPIAPVGVVPWKALVCAFVPNLCVQVVTQIDGQAENEGEER